MRGMEYLLTSAAVKVSYGIAHLPTAGNGPDSGITSRLITAVRTQCQLIVNQIDNRDPTRWTPAGVWRDCRLARLTRTHKLKEHSNCNPPTRGRRGRDLRVTVRLVSCVKDNCDRIKFRFLDHAIINTVLSGVAARRVRPCAATRVAAWASPTHLHAAALDTGHEGGSGHSGGLQQHGLPGSGSSQHGRQVPNLPPARSSSTCSVCPCS